jgi:hypothetical protein
MNKFGQARNAAANSFLRGEIGLAKEVNAYTYE